MGIEVGRMPFKSIRFPDEDLENEFAKENGRPIILFDERFAYQDVLSGLVLDKDYEGAFLLAKERERRDGLTGSFAG